MIEGNNNIKVTSSKYNRCIDCYMAKMANVQGYSICPFCTNSIKN